MQIIQLIRSVVFIFLMYLTMLVMSILYGIGAIFKPDVAFTATDHYCKVVRFFAHYVVGLKSEVRGEVPTDEVLICSKHQSFFDIILIVSAVPRPKFIMKKQILYTPLVGFWAKRLGCIAVDRGKRGAAVKKMIADVTSGASKPGQLIIFPQGTRVAAGAKKPYKIGSGVIYSESGQRCVPVATNVGVFWPKHGLLRKPGLAVIEFLPAVEPGLPINDFMEHLEEVVEDNSNRLMREAGFDPDSHEHD